ncbi:MAG: hypothetical protein KDA52_20090 [Planctomycetaceae bacterium]|nr:hypothetical protein [Planctomycetaceae bacterium]
MISPRVLILLLLTVCGRMTDAADATNDLELRDGDRVVLLGGTIIEREQRFGHWETLLTIAHADKHITFRNLGWSGDTVWGESRGMFEPHLGYQRLIEEVTAANPTVVLVDYGSNEAFAGEERLVEFVAQYVKLLDDLAADGRRFILLSPMHLEPIRVPYDPDAAADFVEQTNANIALYSKAIETLALDGGHGFVDLLSLQSDWEQPQREFDLTFNGLTLTDQGYLLTGRWLASFFSPAINFDELDVDSPSITQLREAIVAKNELFFHRWRPQNFTYLYSFRKHEQGNNAVEIPQFDPLVEQAEQEIEKLASAVGQD